jgi:hypothetical protein
MLAIFLPVFFLLLILNITSFSLIDFGEIINIEFNNTLNYNPFSL